MQVHSLQTQYEQGLHRHSPGLEDCKASHYHSLDDRKVSPKAWVAKSNTSKTVHRASVKARKRIHKYSQVQ